MRLLVAGSGLWGCWFLISGMLSLLYWFRVAGLLVATLGFKVFGLEGLCFEVRVGAFRFYAEL